MMTAPISGPQTVSMPPTMTTSRNRIDWKNGNESGLMKFVADAKTPPATPAVSERGVADHDRIETDRNAGDLRISDRAHRSAPSADAQLAEEEDCEHGEREYQIRDRAVRELDAEQCGRRNSRKPVPAASQPTPFRRALFDHE